MSGMPSGEPIVEARSIVKRYGSVQANDGVSLTLSGGEVHALLGENGAGKSTLSKILYGFTRPDSGNILVRGKAVEFRSPRDARAQGIGMVFQNFMLIPALSVTENIALFLADLPLVVRRGAVQARIRRHAERLGLRVNLDAPVRQLSVGDQQKVEILRLLLAEARVFILDEPTKVLAPHEVEELFKVFEALKAEGYAILFITHKLREVIACADRITVMRQGRVTGELVRGAADAQALVGMMFGEKAPSAQTGSAVSSGPAGKVLLELVSAATRAAGSETALRDVNLRIAEGEIVGVAGVSGSGQKELGDLILGLRPLVSGRKVLLGEDASAWPIGRIREAGVAFVPEDCLGMAAVPGMTVRENLVLGTGRRYHRGSSIDWRSLELRMGESFRALDFPLPALDGRIGGLSGGNLQRTVIAREMAHGPKLVVALYPTRGLDVRSAVSVRDLLRRARSSGAGVLLISEDLEELAEMSRPAPGDVRRRTRGRVPARRMGRRGDRAPDDGFTRGDQCRLEASRGTAIFRFFAPLARYAGITAIVLAVFACVLLLAGKNPIKAYVDTFRYTLANAYGFSELLVRMTPLLLTAVAVAIPSRLGLINVGGEGQLYLGAWAATAAALLFPTLPVWVLLPLVAVAGFAGGAVWAAIPGILRARKLVNETIATLLLNYVAPLIVSFFIFGPWRSAESSAYPQSAAFPDAARLPSFFNTRINAGLLIALVVLLGYWILMERTRWGVEMRAIGGNPEAAQRLGIPVAAYVVIALAIGGGLAGLAGHGRSVGYSLPASARHLSGLRVHGLSHRLACRRAAAGNAADGLPVCRSHLRG